MALRPRGSRGRRGRPGGKDGGGTVEAATLGGERERRQRRWCCGAVEPAQPCALLPSGCYPLKRGSAHLACRLALLVTESARLTRHARAAVAAGHSSSIGLRQGGQAGGGGADYI